MADTTFLPCIPGTDPVTGEWACGVCGRHGNEDCDPVPHALVIEGDDEGT